MKIAYIAAGAGGMYCGMCLHDNTLAAALIEAGEEILLIPTYTPLRTDEVDVSQRQIFFGGVTVYLKEKMSLFRHAPRWLTGLLDRRSFLRFATRRAGSVDPKNLGDLTVSMLQGEKGHQYQELEQLVHWLETEVQPDVVHLSNAMLLGMAREFRRRLKTPIVCSLSGEDVFLERLDPPYYEQARALLKERAVDVDSFVAWNRYYGDTMAQYMEVDPRRVEVIPHGLNLAGHGTRSKPAEEKHVTIGYLARICHDKGLHLLVEAFEHLVRDTSLPPLRLRVAGYLGSADRKYFAEIERRIAAAALADRYEYVGEPDRAGKIAFLQSLDMMGLPTVYRESKGLPVLEALANAVPVVLPDHGTFPELIEDTGGGVLFRAGDVASLAEELTRLIRSPELAARYGQQGQQAVYDRYHAGLMAQRTRALYQRLTSRAPASVPSGRGGG